MRKNGQFRPCTICGKLVWRKRCRLPENDREGRRNVYCSQSCYQVWWRENVPVYRSGSDCYNWKGGKIERTCQCCGNTFYVCRNHLADSRKFCSLACRGKHYSGERSHLWKGGISNERDKAKATEEYAEWRRTVYARDHYMCVLCLRHFRSLHAHHIKRFSDYTELRFDVDNGATLCQPCHHQVHTNEELFEDLLRSRILRDFTSDTRVPLDIVKIKSELHGDMKRLAEMTSPCA